MSRNGEISLYAYPKQKILRRVALVFPEHYRIGMASLGFQGVYHLLQSYAFLHVERFFFQGNERPLSVESGRSIDEFDVIMASVSFEVDILHLVRMLGLSGIALEREKRQHPALVVGGIGCSLLTPYLSRMADIVVVTNAEYALPLLVEALVSHDEKWYLHVKTGAGVFRADEMGDNHAPFVSHGVDSPLHTVILTPDNEFSMRGLIEVSRGCQYQCAFCLVSHMYGEYRYFSQGDIVRTAQLYRHKTHKLGLVAATLTNHPEFENIVDSLNSEGFEISFSAFRIETLSPKLLEKIIANEKKTLVMAPESASDGQKRFLRKMIPNDVFLERVRQAIAIGIKRIKLYFLIGLPGETEEDLAEMVALVKSIALLSKGQAKIFGYVPEIIVDVNPLVPKPFTALAGFEMAETALLKKRVRFLKQHLQGLGRVFVSGESPRRARLQYDLAWGKISFEEMVALSKVYGE